MAHDVFISYASDDKITADATCATLECEQIRCWIAPRDVRPSADYGEEIVKAIKESRLMMVVFSNHTNLSAHVKNEVERAVSAGIPIIPFRIEDVLPKGSLELHLSRVHWLDALTPPLEEHLRRLADIVHRILKDPEEYESMVSGRIAGQRFLFKYRFHILGAAALLATIIAIVALVTSRGQLKVEGPVARLPELSDDIVGTVADSLFPGKRSGLNYLIVKPKTMQPLLFLVLQYRRDIIFSAIKNVNEKWTKVWEHRDDGDVFAVSDQQVALDDEELLLTYSGCFPHMCPNSWGFCVYDIKANDGWVAKCLRDEARDVGKADFPLGFPGDVWQLLKYEDKLMKNSLLDTFIEDPASCGQAVLRGLPAKRFVAPLFENNIPSQVQSKLNNILKGQDCPRVDAVYLVDTDGDGSLKEVIVCGGAKGERESRFHVYKNDKLYALPEDQEGPPRCMWLARYPVPGKPPHLVFAGVAGSGNFGNASVYQLNGSEYVVVRDKEGRMVREFGIGSRYAEPAE